MAEPIKPTAVAVGCGVIGFLVVCVVGLYRRRQYRVLMAGVLMGLLPLAVALGIDVLTNKYTLGCGWGRSTMVALPCWARAGGADGWNFGGVVGGECGGFCGARSPNVSDAKRWIYS